MARMEGFVSILYRYVQDGRLQGLSVIECTDGNLFSAPTKFVPLSDQFIEGVPRLAMNLFTPIMKELAS